jgi:hypothetical protein
LGILLNQVLRRANDDIASYMAEHYCKRDATLRVCVWIAFKGIGAGGASSCAKASAQLFPDCIEFGLRTNPTPESRR